MRKIKKQIKYVSDVFLDEFKTNFEDKYLQYYDCADRNNIEKIFSNPKNIISSSQVFDYEPLILESNFPDSALENIKIIWKSLKHLTPTEAENEKLWVAMENTYYLDYHLDILKQIKGSRRKSSLISRTIFNQGTKRSLAINNISLLWWIAYYLIDEENAENPFHLIEYFVSGSYRGNSVGFFSSNIVSKKNLSLGVVEAIKELTEEGKMTENRYSYTNSNKLLNQSGGVRILDLLNRSEIKKMIKDNLLQTDNIKN